MYFDVELSDEDVTNISNCGGFVAHLRPGETLYIPHGWCLSFRADERASSTVSNAARRRWHTVTNMTDDTLVQRRRASPLSSLG